MERVEGRENILGMIFQAQFIFINESKQIPFSLGYEATLFLILIQLTLVSPGFFFMDSTYKIRGELSDLYFTFTLLHFTWRLENKGVGIDISG